MNYSQGGNTGRLGFVLLLFINGTVCMQAVVTTSVCVATPPVSFGFALIVLCLSLQVEDRDYLEKVNGKLLSRLFLF